MPECNEKQEKRKLIDAKIAELKELCPTLLVLGRFYKEDENNKAIAAASGRIFELVALIKCFLDINPEAKIAMALIDKVEYSIDKGENAEDASKK